MTDWQDDILKEWQSKQKKKDQFITDELRDRLAREFKGEVLYREPMAKHTSMRVGGPADVYLKPKDIPDLVTLINIAKEEGIPFHFIGSGSNTLVKDGGIRGFVITPPSSLNECRVSGSEGEYDDLEAGAAVKLNRFVTVAKEAGLTGNETFVGIPGSIGGALAMNAGAHGVEMQDIVRSITVVDKDGEVATISREKLDFEYRKLKLPKTTMILSATFRLKKGENEAIAKKVEEHQKWRVEKQPLNYPSLGSVFKNPPPPKKGKAVSAGMLIEDAGLKNVRVGGARVSDKHANFIINENNATARDVIVLINLIRDKIKETGVVLETEIKIVGEDA